MTKPKAIGPGSTLGVIAPASAVKEELLDRGVAQLYKLGFRVKVLPHVLDRGPLNYAGTLEARLGDLHAAFADDEVDGIVCARGGWGAAELLPHLDGGLIRANPKVFVGYSDVTSLHVWMQREMGMVSFQGPMVASDFSKDDGVDAYSWRCALMQEGGWTLGAESGLRVLRAGTAQGVLSGGCMSIYAEALGTPFAAEVRGGVLGKVLFFEDVRAQPYQWDRMLLHVRYAGLLEGVTGIVFGDMTQCCAPGEEALLDATLLHALRGFAGPIGIGLRSGHVDGGNITLPFGVEVRLEFEDVGNPRMHFVEASVTG